MTVFCIRKMKHNEDRTAEFVGSPVAVGTTVEELEYKLFLLERREPLGNRTSYVIAKYET